MLDAMGASKDGAILVEDVDIVLDGVDGGEALRFSETLVDEDVDAGNHGVIWSERGEVLDLVGFRIR